MASNIAALLAAGQQWQAQRGAAAARRWQDQYALPGWQNKLTRLTPLEEQMFQVWATKHKAPITDDYDMRGFWKNHGVSAVNSNDGMLHYSDRYKTPLHQSFSGESIYANPASKPPRWNERDQLVDRAGRVIFDERNQR